VATEMVAAQALVTVLWAATLTSGAPQGLALNQNQVVSEVVVALQPSIAKAVADALAGLNSRSVTSTSIASRGSLSGGSRGSVSSLSASSRSRSGAAGTASATASGAEPVGPTARPVYNFQYKVADDAAQTYISQEEARDGDDLSGTYSYVDADGALVTVNYEAGAMGYSETRDKQDGFVQIRAKPIKTQAVAVDNSAAIAAARAQAAAKAQAAAAAARKAEAARAAAARQEAARLEAVRLEAARIEASRQASSVNANSIVSQVISSLQPLISRTVEGVISSSSGASSSNFASSSSSSSSGSSLGSVSRTVSSGDIASTFGNGGLTVSVETPDVQFAY